MYFARLFGVCVLLLAPLAAGAAEVSDDGQAFRSNVRVYDLALRADGVPEGNSSVLDLDSNGLPLISMERAYHGVFVDSDGNKVDVERALGLGLTLDEILANSSLELHHSDSSKGDPVHLLMSRYVQLTPDGRTVVPVLKGYTSALPAASGGGRIFGTATRPMKLPNPSQGFVLESGHEPQGLGYLPGDHVSRVTDCSADGTRAVGFSIGDNTERPCVWDRNEDGSWTCSVLPCASDLNPVLTFGIDKAGVHISPNGLVAASVGYMDSHNVWTYKWTNENGTWKREVLAERTLACTGVNDHGMVVGHYRVDQLHRQAFVVMPDGEFRALGTLLKGQTSSAALGVNNHGVVVGYSMDWGLEDWPHDGFVWTAEGGMQKLDLGPGVDIAYPTCINDDGVIAGWAARPDEYDPYTRAFVYTPESN